MIKNIVNIVWDSRFIHYFGITGIGLCLNLLITTMLTELIFNREKYFIGYVIGVIINLLFNFILHTIITFKSKVKHFKRLFMFMAYHISMSIVQALLIRFIVPKVGYDYYLFVIVLVIGVFYIYGFYVSKYWIFKKKNK